MFFRSPLWRLISIAISAGILIAVYLGPIKNATKESKDADKQATELTRAPNASEDLYRAANFRRALRKLRQKEGANAPMLEIQVRRADAEFQIRNGERAHGYRYDAKAKKLTPERVQIVGGGSIANSDFSLTQVPGGITRKLATKVRARGDHATNMSLSRTLTQGRLAWTINADGGGRTGLVFQANPNGSGFHVP